MAVECYNFESYGLAVQLMYNEILAVLTVDGLVAHLMFVDWTANSAVDKSYWRNKK